MINSGWGNIIKLFKIAFLITFIQGLQSALAGEQQTDPRKMQRAAWNNTDKIIMKGQKDGEYQKMIKSENLTGKITEISTTGL